MNNLKDGGKKFQSSFDSAPPKSTIRKTTQEKDAKSLAQNFEKQTNSMYGKFKKPQKAEPCYRIASILTSRLRRS